MQSLQDELARALRLAESAVSEELRIELLGIAARLTEELIQSTRRDLAQGAPRTGRPGLQLVRLTSEYVCRSKDVVVGIIEPHGEMWHWQAIGVEVHACGAQSEGLAETLDSAYKALSKSWQAWLVAAGLVECCSEHLPIARIQQTFGQRPGLKSRGR
jgi:hypothetical protein